MTGASPLLTLVHDPGVDALVAAGRVLDRRAVKAVALRGRDLLLLRAGSGAVKLPGGGVEPGESDEQALRRELDEECGVPLVGLGDDLGDTVQLSRALEPEYDVFRMTSRYLGCQVGDPQGPGRLEAYEVALGMTPVWVDLAEAVATTAAQVEAGTPHRWLARELAVLRTLS